MTGKARLIALACVAGLLLAGLGLARPGDQAQAQVQDMYVVYLPLAVKNYVPPPTQVLPNDPLFLDGSQWGLRNTGQNDGVAGADINASLAWALTTGDAGVIVAVVDTGVDADHPDLAGKLLSGHNFVAGAVDPNNTDDDVGHGTHVAGIAAAISNNTSGVSGVSWGARILPVKSLYKDDTGRVLGYDTWIANGITYAADNGAKVINLSVGGTSASSTITEAIEYAYGKGVFVVAAAGNCGDSNYSANGCTSVNQPFYPAASAHTLAVAATDRLDGHASFSTQATYVDVAAPGASIVSSYVGGGYATLNGTSMAAPYVTGLSALILSRYPSYGPEQLARAIVNNADDLGATGYDTNFGCGRIDAYRSLTGGDVASGCSGWGGYAASLSAAATVDAAANADKPHRPGVVLVKFKDPATAKARGLGREAVPGLGIYEISVPPGQEVAKRAELASDVDVEFAETDHLVYALEN
jgi:subtilisin family serine protease